METNNYTYQAIAIQQTPSSKPFYVIGCKAEELLTWCDVPRKKEEFMAGYQRELMSRHEKIKEFFELDSTHNIIPNAVIVALREENIKVIDNKGNSSVTIEISQKQISHHEAIQTILQEFEARLHRLTFKPPNPVMQSISTHQMNWAVEDWKSASLLAGNPRSPSKHRILPFLCLTSPSPDWA